MGIESLTSAAAAAGFAMVSEEAGDGTEVNGEADVFIPSGTAPATSQLPALTIQLPALMEHGKAQASSALALGASLGERVTGMIEAWRQKN